MCGPRRNSQVEKMMTETMEKDEHRDKKNGGISRIRRLFATGYVRLTEAGLELLTWLPWTLLVSILPGLVTWQATDLSQLAQIHENRILSMVVLMYAAISSIAFICVSIAAYLLLLRKRGVRPADFFRSVNRFGAILVIPLIYFFVQPTPGNGDAPFFTMMLCTGAGIVAAWSAYAIPRLGVLFVAREQLRQWAPLIVVVGLATAWAVVVARMGLRHHANLGTAGWDFGLYINSIWQSLHGHPLACSLVAERTHASRHFDPILILISPILLIRPGAEAQILMSFQVAWIASGVVPLYLLTVRQTRNGWFGVVLSAVYLLHPAFHGSAVYDFHSLVLAGPLMLWCIHLLESGATVRFFIALFLLIITREDMSAIALLIGIYALMRRKPALVTLGTLALPLTYGAIVYFTIFAKAISYSQYFNHVDSADRSVASNILLTGVTNPMYLLKYLLSEPKIVYLLQLVVPLLFLPIFARRYWVLYLFGLLMTLAGSKSRLFSLSMQYVTWWVPFMIAALPTAIEEISNGRIAGALKLDAAKLRGALLVGVLFSAFTMSVAYGIFWPNPSFRAGYTKLIRTPDEKQMASGQTVLRIEQMLPPEASVLASEHLVSHFSARKQIWTTENTGYGFEDPDYGVVWNQDLRYQHGRKSKMKRRQRFLKMLRDTRKYERILSENGISLYKRKPESKSESKPKNTN